MIQALRQRLDRDEEGFTLIELMVVVLIIAILLAIAIPTFLGARGKAQNRAAQSNLRNALTAEKTVFTDASSYSVDVAAAGVLFTAEPSIKWAASSINAQTVGQVGVAAVTKNQAVAATLDNLVLSAVDPSGTKCWFVVDESVTNAAATAIVAGTFYGYSTSVAGTSNCTAMTLPTGPTNTTVATVGPAAAGAWGTTW